MGFQGVCRAIYDYAPQAEGELTITEGDLLYMLDTNSDDGWWKAKKKANTDDGDEPVGLVPNNYVEEAEPVAKARALFEYTRQTDEELSFPEDAVLVVYDTSDEDWILVGLDEDFGFVPANYIEVADDSTAEPAAIPAAPPLPPSLPSRPPVVANESDEDAEARSPASPAQPVSPPANNPAAALAGVMGGRSVAPPPRAVASPPPMSPQSPQYRASDEDEEEVRSPALPARPASQVSAPPRPDSAQRQTYAADSSDDRSGPLRVPGGFHMYNINEMVSVMGKRKKMPTTLGINLGTATILIAPEKANDGPTQEWTADKMTHYSREGKHVFMELVRPSKSIDFHAGAKDTAEEIVGALGELAGAIRAAGLRELIMAGTGKQQKKGSVLYDFMAQGDDEVTVAVGDEVLIIDNAKSEEWWQVRRLRNGKEGVVPSSYIEITGAVTPPSSSSGANAGLSTVEQNRLEEIRLTKEAMKAARQEPQQQQVGPGMPLPERASSLQARDSGNNSEQRSKRENGRSDTKSKPKPDSSKVRTWTDRTRSFSVEAQFLGLKDGKINLHKMNGVKIAVPIAKMSLDDLEYVESVTGISLDEDKPLSNVKKTQKAASDTRGASGASGASGSAEPAGASIEQPPQKPEYDWFQFFLDCEVPVGVCERYAQAFNRESMDESILPDVDASVLRNLGLREGDILKVMRHLDLRFGRNKKSKDANEGEEGEGGLFSGPGGALRNNTRKGRPAPAVQTNDVVDPKAFKADGDKSDERDASRSPAPESSGKPAGGFDDDAWDVKPSKKAPEPAKAPAEAPRQTAIPTGAMSELSLLTAPLEPNKTASPQNYQLSPVLGQPAPAPQAPQPTGATPGFFAANNQPPQQQQQQRQRPVPPQVSGGQSSLPPPPARPGSAPQAAQPSGFMPPPMAPQMTGAYAGRVAPAGQSLEEMNHNRMQQQQFAMQQQQQLPPQQYPQMTGFPGQQQQLGPMQSYPTGMPQNHGQFMQPMMTGQMPPQQQGPSQFSPMQAQQTGYGGGQQFPPPQQQQQPFIPQPTGVNSYLPPALEPQRTGMPPMQPMQTGAMGQSQVPSPPQALQPQQTGPAPPVRFGVTGGPNRLTSQQTGRKANLSHATPDNPFGF